MVCNVPKHRIYERLNADLALELEVSLRIPKLLFEIRQLVSVPVHTEKSPYSRSRTHVAELVSYIAKTPDQAVDPTVQFRWHPQSIH